MSLFGNNTNKPLPLTFFGNTGTQLQNNATPIKTTSGIPTNTSSLNMGNNNTSAAPINSLFGNSTSTSTTNSLFGNSNNNASKSTTTNLFGNNSTNPNTTSQSYSLIGNTNSNGPATPMFGSNIANKNTTSTNLFGNTSNPLNQLNNNNSNTNNTSSTPFTGASNPGTNSLIPNNNYNNNSLIPLSMTNNNTNIFQQFSLYNTNRNNDNFRQFFLNEIIQVLYSFQQSLEPRSPYNIFRAVFFNRIPKQVNFNVSYDQYINSFHNYNQIILGEDNKETYFDQQLFIKHLDANPDKYKFYSTAVCSPYQLLIRLNTAKLVQLNTIKTVIDLNSSFYEISESYNKEIKKMINECQIKKERIKDKMLSVVVKLEKVARIVNKANIDLSKESDLFSKFSELHNKLNNGRILQKIDKIKIDSDKAIENKEYTDKSAISNEDKELEQLKNKTIHSFVGYNEDSNNNNKNEREMRNKEYLKHIYELKKLSEGLFENINQNLEELNFLKSEISVLTKLGG